MDVGQIEHALAGEGRDGIGAGDEGRVGGIEGLEDRLQIAALHQVVARAVGEIGQRRFGDFGSRKTFGWLAP